MKTEQLTEKLVSWIREQVSAAHCQGVVVGMSGGIDSSVVAVLCHQAFPQSMLGLILPCYSIHDDAGYAQAVAGKFSIATKTVILDGVFDVLCRVLPNDKTASPWQQVAEANLKSRLRMLTLYYFANKLNYMVAGSSNRDELTIGYFTKYGDGGVDFMPLGNLLKSQVRELARYLGIPQEIINKPPSPGLWPGQTSEGELGFSYDEVDRYLLTGEASQEFKEKIESRKVASNHKRLPPPVAKF